MYHKPANTLRSKVVHPKDNTPLENKCGTIYHITCVNDPTHTYIGESKRPLGVRFKEHLNLDKLTGVGEHCLATGHSVAKNNVRVLSREQEWHRRKVKEAICIKQQGPTMNCDQGYQLPPHLHPDPSAGIWVNSKTCVTKICRNRSKRCIFSSKSLQSKFQFTIKDTVC